MADATHTSPWALRMAFVALALTLILFQLLPLETTARRWAGPDLMTALAFAWAVRRPETVPVALLAGVFLLADLVFQRPPGLWAALIVLACEWLRGRASGLRSQPFASEWLTVTLALVGITLLNRFTLALSVTDMPPLTLVLSQMGMTALAYPLVVLFSRFFFGIRPRRPGDSTKGIGA